MTFTESDVENDGLIKREVGKEMAKVAQTQNPELYEYFVNVSEEIGRDPKDIFGEMVVRALNSDEYSERIFNSEVSMGDLRADEIRMDDVKYVMQLADELDLNEERDTNDPIDDLVNQRIQNVTKSPLEQFTQRKRQGTQQGIQQQAGVGRIEERLDRIEQRVTDGEPEQTVEEGGGVQEQQQSVDDLFEVGDETEEDGNGGETEVDEGSDLDDEAIDEAMEGLGGSDDNQDEPGSPGNDFKLDIPSDEQQDGNGVFDSANGEEE